MMTKKSKQYSVVDIAPTVSAILNLPPPAQATGSVISEIAQDLSTYKRIIVLAPDALGVFAWQKWQNEMLFLKSLHAKHSIILCSIMPSVTPVNFAAIVTGADLSAHGVHDKTDKFECETLFDVVRKAGGKSAGVGLEGYTGYELLGRHADIQGSGGNRSDAGVEEKIIEIVDHDTPQFLIAQFGKVDDIFHRYGPSSPLVVPMLKETDARLQRLTKHLKHLNYGVIIVSDHGQHDVINARKGENKGAHGTDMSEDCLVPCTWI